MERLAFKTQSVILFIETEGVARQNENICIPNSVFSQGSVVDDIIKE